MAPVHARRLVHQVEQAAAVESGDVVPGQRVLFHSVVCATRKRRPARARETLPLPDYSGPAAIPADRAALPVRPAPLGDRM